MFATPIYRTNLRNMENWFSRTELLINSNKMQILTDAHVMIVGLGGVGGATAEMLCRAGVGEMTIVDGKIVWEEENV